MNSQLLNMMPRIPNVKAKKLRRQGYIPGVYYGENHTNLPVIFDKKKVESFISQAGENAMLEVSLNGEIQPVRIREVQKDPITQEILHIDLQDVKMDKKIQFKIPLKFEGKQIIEKRGYILQHQKDTIDVEGLAKNMPSHINVPLHVLQNKQSIRVQDLEIAEEISIVDAPNQIIALVVRPSSGVIDARVEGLVEETASIK